MSYEEKHISVYYERNNDEYIERGYVTVISTFDDLMKHAAQQGFIRLASGTGREASRETLIPWDRVTRVVTR